MRLVGFIPSHHLRKYFYRLAGMRIGRRSYIYAGAEIRAPRNIVIGDDVIVGHRAILDGRGGLTIGNNVNLSTGVWIWTLQHDPQSPTFAAVGAPVCVESDAWLSCRTVILPGVTISRGCVVAAGAVVTKTTTHFKIWGGVPAKEIGSRIETIAYRLGETPVTPFA